MADEFDIVKFMEFLAEPEQTRYEYKKRSETSPTGLVKFPLIGDHIGVFAEQKLMDNHPGFFGDRGYVMFCIASADGMIELLSDSVIISFGKKNPFPGHLLTFNQYSRRLSSIALRPLLPIIQASETLQKKYMKQEGQRKLSQKIMARVSLDEIGNNPVYLKEPFSEAVKSWPFFGFLSFSLGEILLNVDGKFDFDKYIEGLERELESPEINDLELESIVEQIFSLKSDLEVIKDVVGTEPEKSLSVRNQIKSAIPPNARLITVYYQDDDGEQIPIELNPKYVFDMGFNSFWLGFNYSSYGEKDPTRGTSWAQNEKGLISTYQNQWIIPWNRIAKVVYRKKQIYTQNQ